MRKRSLSRRERDMVEEAVTRVCLALGADEKDEDIRQAAWAEILAVYREDPVGFWGGALRGWWRAYDLAGDAILAELRARQHQVYGQISLDKPVRGDTEATLLQLLHSPAGSFEGGVCLWDYLSRQPPDVRRTAQALLEGETLGQLRDDRQWTWEYAYGTFSRLRAAMEEYQKIQ